MIRAVLKDNMPPFNYPPFERPEKSSACPDSGLEFTLKDPESGLGIPDEQAMALSNICMFLALAFRYPKDDVYAEISRHLPRLDVLFTDYSICCPSLPDRPELEAEYVSLFVNNNGYVPAVPYAASYLDLNGLLMGPSYELVRKYLRLTGYELRAPVKDLEDHVSLLLEFAAGLLSRLSDSGPLSSRGELELRVLCSLILQILCPMSGPFGLAVRANAQAPFYPAVAETLQALMQDLKQLCTGLVSVPPTV